MSPEILCVDVIEHVAQWDPNTALTQLRAQKPKVLQCSQSSFEVIMDRQAAGLSWPLRCDAAAVTAQHSQCPELADFYRRLSTMDDPPTKPPSHEAVLNYVKAIAQQPLNGDQAALLRLQGAGLGAPELVTLLQLIGFVTYQARVIQGLKALATLQPQFNEPTGAPEATPFVHPAHQAIPGQPVRLNGFTSEPLGWKAWLQVLDMNLATPEQIKVLEASHPSAKTSDYYLTLAQQPRILQERSDLFNAIMYAPGGLSRAERELASTVVSRVNGCVYCASVHALRFEQLTKRNDVIAQVFQDPDTAGTTLRERSIVQASIDLTLSPADFSERQIQALSTAGLNPAEVLDLIHSVAIFAWANRLMLNLGEPVFPQPELS